MEAGYGWGPEYSDYGRNAWLKRDSKQFRTSDVELQTKLLKSPHYNPLIQLENMSLTGVRIMLAYTYLLAVCAIIYTTYIEDDLDEFIQLYILNPFLAVGYVVIAVLFLRNCCCDCHMMWLGKTKRVREQVWIFLTLFICALCSGEFVAKTFGKAMGMSKRTEHESDRISKIVASAVLTSSLKLLWLLLMDSFGRVKVHEFGFYIWKFLFALINIAGDSSLLILGYDPYGREVMLTTWIFYGAWCLWLIVLMFRTSSALERYSYIQTRMRQLGFRFFCFQTTVIMTSIIGCLGIAAYRKARIVVGYQMVAHGYMLLLGWCYMPLPTIDKKHSIKTLETATVEVFESLGLLEDTEFEVSKMCLLLSWEVYHVEHELDSKVRKQLKLADNNPFNDEVKKQQEKEPQPAYLAKLLDAMSLQGKQVQELWVRMGGWSIALRDRPRILRILESEEHIRCMIARLDHPGVLIISFRGTSNVRNMITDCRAWRKSPDDFGTRSQDKILRSNGIYIHSGFWEAYISIRMQLLAALSQYLNPEVEELGSAGECTERIPIIFTGHSLGGALAVLAALDIRTLKGPPQDRIGCITFGQPRVGNREFANFVEKMVPSFFRVVYERDIVTGQPGIPILFKHAGFEAVVDDKGNCIPQPSFVEKTFMASKTHLKNHMTQAYVRAYASNITLHKMYTSK
eukprot:CAMPEP_0167750432 /NCGR_PEP_ID=MMETSP0110_2-20121227/5988_1 /TAXON_ID=629695 /ORGANISM="Gymnochlora sp., Strain CCMP2014" /LENGTH=683 /DNA_ID=CAMNT_0007635753 /DNA_START=1061 /DNA_END=3112 /DNA_ORIENTATION=+